jgi:cell division transport system permease protein
MAVMSGMPPDGATNPPAVRLRPFVLVAVAVVAALVGAAIATVSTIGAVRDEPLPERRYEVRATLDTAATSEQTAAVQAAMTSRFPTGTIRVESREEALQRFRETFKDQPELLEKVGPESLPESLVLATAGKGFDCAALEPVERMDGVSMVRVRQLAGGGRPDATILDCP